MLFFKKIILRLYFVFVSVLSDSKRKKNFEVSEESVQIVGEWFQFVVQQQSELEVWINEKGLMVFGRDDYTWPSCSLRTTDFEELINNKLDSLEKQFRKKEQQYSHLLSQFNAIFDDFESDEEEE